MKTDQELIDEMAESGLEFDICYDLDDKPIKNRFSSPSPLRCSGRLSVLRFWLW